VVRQQGHEEGLLLLQAPSNHRAEPRQGAGGVGQEQACKAARELLPPHTHSNCTPGRTTPCGCLRGGWQCACSTDQPPLVRHTSRGEAPQRFPPPHGRSHAPDLTLAERGVLDQHLEHELRDLGAVNLCAQWRQTARGA